MRHFIWFYLFIIGLDFWLSTQTHNVWVKWIDIAGGIVWIVVFVGLFIRLFVQPKKAEKSIK